MILSNLRIDRFGLRSKLKLDQLSPELNLVYGPNGTGKTTAIHFVRWVLFGRQDDATRRCLSAGHGTSAGSLSARRRECDFTIRREDDGSAEGRVSVTGTAPAVDNPRDTRTLLDGMGSDEFDRLCVLSFDRPLDIKALIEGAQARGLELIHQTEADPRALELRSRLDSQRRELASLPELREELVALADLQQRRQRLRRQLESAVELSRRESETIRNELEQVTSEMKRVEAELATLCDGARQLEVKVTAEQQRNEAEGQIRARVTQQFLEQHRLQLAEMDAELDCWCHLLDELEKARKQRETVFDRHSSFRVADDEERPDGRACAVDPVARRVRQLREQWSGTPPTHQGGQPAEPANFAQTLDWLQADIGQLCQQLQDGRNDVRRKALRGEVSQLRICYESLTRVVETLRQRREDLAYELWAAERGGVSARIGPQRDAPAPSAEADSIGTVFDHDGVVVSVCGCVSTDTNDWTIDRQETETRPDALQQKIHERKQRLHELRGRLQQLQRRPQEQDSEGSIQELQRELQSIESQIVALDERDCLRRTIASLEQELDRLEDQVTQPEILQKASGMLRQLTGDQHVSLRITPERQLWIDSSSGQAAAYDHLSRGTQDQAYLCVSLAILAAYRQRGLELPVILNGAFANVDAQRGQAMAELISEYASAGNQVLLFTQHPHVITLFRNRTATLFELQPTGETHDLHASGPEHRTAGRDNHESSSPIRRSPRHNHSPMHPQHERYVIRRRQWTAEEFPGELTDRVRVASRDRSGVPAACVRIRQADIDTTKSVPHDDGHQQSASQWRQHIQPQFYLTPSDPVTEAPSIGPQTARKLERLGVNTVADLRSIHPETAVAQIADARISPETICQWQAEATLMCGVPRLRAIDARALVRCAVTNIERLAQSDARSLQKIIARTVRSMKRDAAEDHDQSPDLTTVASWVVWAKSTTARRAA